MYDENDMVNEAMGMSVSHSETAAETGGNNDMVAAIAAELSLPEDVAQEILNDDPEFAELAKKSLSANGENKGGEGHTSGEEPEGNTAANGDKISASLVVDDKNSGDKEDGDGTFADDVIEGLKGAEFKKLSDDAQNAISAFYENAQAKTKEAEAYKAQVDGLMNDPIISSRAAAIENGNADVYVRGITEKEKAFIADINLL